MKNQGAGGLVDLLDFPIDNNVWHHLVANRGNGQLKIYIDGVNLYSTGILYPGQIDLSTNTFSMGARTITDTNGFFKGSLDEVRIYNRALSDSEIKALYNATK